MGRLCDLPRARAKVYVKEAHDANRGILPMRRPRAGRGRALCREGCLPSAPARRSRRLPWSSQAESPKAEGVPGGWPQMTQVRV